MAAIGFEFEHHSYAERGRRWFLQLSWPTGWRKTQIRAWYW